MFIIRAVFWLAVVALLLPTGERSNEQEKLGAFGISAETSAQSTEFTAGDAAVIAVSSVQDVMGFCDRNPAACEAGGEALAHIKHQFVTYGTRIARWVAEESASIGESDGTAIASEQAI